MRFQLLGPLEVVVDGRAVQLSGKKQRAALAFLLFHANQVVATSRLLEALWPDQVPPTARRMLQNAVSGLRGVLAAGGDAADSAILLTHAPGYLLRVEPDLVDLHRFRCLVDQGRAELASGSAELASGTLREALALWRGPVLADLVENGIGWPELTAVQKERLAAQEDLFEAELSAGHHRVVASELETQFEIGPPRERLCAQLMLALYRCGRQADALHVYQRARTALIGRLGLEPGHELQDLEQAILNHDPALDLPAVPRIEVRSGDAPASAPPAEASELAAVHPIRSAPSTLNPAARSAPAATVNGTATPTPSPGTDPPAAAADVRKRVSVALVLVQLDPQTGDDDPECVDIVCDKVAAVVRGEVERLGGIMSGGVDKLSSGQFRVGYTREEDAAQAAQATLAIRDRRRGEDHPESLSQPEDG